jgi:hypothetical protein
MILSTSEILFDCMRYCKQKLYSETSCFLTKEKTFSW